MYISTKDWKNYIDKMRALNEKAADAIVNYVQKNGFENTDELVGFANSVVQKYGGGSAALAAAMYDATADASGQFYDSAEPAPLPEYGEVAKTVHGTLKRSRNVNELGGAVSRLVKRAGADTTLLNAYRDRPKYGKKRNTGAQVAWIPFGDTCPFCLMLASNGWRNQTVGGAEHHAKHIHANCDCNYAVRFDNHSGVQGYDPDKYKEMFDNVEGDTWSQKVNSMRRENYDKNKDQINAQKRAAYALRKDSKLEQHKDGDKVFITDQAINKVKSIGPSDYSKDEMKLLQSMNKRILEEAKNNNNSNEVAMALVDGVISKPVFGKESSVDLYGDSDMYHVLKGKNTKMRSVTLSHNHPGLSYFSLKDIGIFIECPSIKTIEVVTNSGKTWYITKKSNYNDLEVMKIYKKTIEENKDNPEKVVDIFLKNIYSMIEKNN